MRRTALRVIPVLILSALPKLVFGQPSTFVQIPLPRYASCIFFEAVPTAMNNRNQVVGHTGPVCDECCFAGRREFLWDPAGGLQYLDLQSDGYLGIDDTGVIWFQRCEGGTCRPLKWVDGAVSEQPMPPGARSTSILKVLRNGIVLVSTVQTDGRRTSWSFDKGTYTDLEALTGARIWTMNQQGALGGCRLLDAEGRAGRPYLRFPNGRVIEPWQTACQTWWNIGSSGVTVLGAGGHFAGIGLTQDGVPVVPTGSLPNEQHAYYGTPDERIWTTGPQRNWTFPLDMNNVGTLLLGSFTFREGTLTDLKQITSHWNEFGPRVINDAGYIAGSFGASLAVLVPVRPSRPSSLSFTVTGRIVTLNWLGSLDASEYLIEAGSAPGLANLYSASAGTLLSLTTPAPPGRYFVRVRARNGAGISDPSNEVVIDVP